MQFKLFTVEQANNLLPEVSRLLAEASHHRQDMVCLLVELDGLRNHQGQAPTDLDLERRVQARMSEVVALRRRLAAVTALLREMGCVVRDGDRGLVDFPTVMEGQPAYLCWCAGEPCIGFWHGPEEGFAGRRPLPQS